MIVFKKLFEVWKIPFDSDVATWDNLVEVASRIVMGDLAQQDEYNDYYANTINSQHGIQITNRKRLEWHKFPKNLRGISKDINILTIDEAVIWFYHNLKTQRSIP